MVPWELVHAHRYLEAESSYLRDIEERAENSGLRAGYATALLCLGRFAEALDRKSAEIRDTEIRDRLLFWRRIGPLAGRSHAPNVARESLKDNVWHVTHVPTLGLRQPLLSRGKNRRDWHAVPAFVSPCGCGSLRPGDSSQMPHPAPIDRR